MKIFVDRQDNICAIENNYTGIEDLKEFDIDRELYFKGLTDYQILNFKFKKNDDYIIIYPQHNFTVLAKLEELNNANKLLENCVLELSDIIGG